MSLIFQFYSADSTLTVEIIVVHFVFWIGKSPVVVHGARKEDFDECVTTHVLLNWC